MFCSVDCRNKTYKIHGDDLEGMLIRLDYFLTMNTDVMIREVQDAFGGHKALLKFLKKNDLNNLKKTIFDFDWCQDVKKNQMICCLSVNPVPSNSDEFILTPPSNKLTKGHPEYNHLFDKLKVLIQSATMREQIKDKPSSELQEELIGVPSTYNIFRTSCSDNVVGLKIVHNKLCVYIQQHVKAGQELFISSSA